MRAVTTMRLLWGGASWWRASVIAAVCATLLVAIFPPMGQSSLTGMSPVASATYVPQPPAAAPRAARTPPSKPAQATPGGTAADALKYGDVISKAAPFAGRDIPLPDGQWRVVASLPAQDQNGVRFDAEALSNEENGRLLGLIFLIGNDKTTPSPTGFRSDGNCERSDMLFVNVVKNDDFGVQECQYIDFISPGVASESQQDSLMRASYGDLKERDVKLPTTLVGANFRLANPKFVLIAKYYFSPDAEGILAPNKPDWIDNDWNKYNISKFPDKSKYVSNIERWIESWKGNIQRKWGEH